MKGQQKSASQGTRYRDLDDEALEKLWKRSGDMNARDILLLRQWRGGLAESGVELLDLKKSLLYRTCLLYGVRIESDIEDVFGDVVVDLMENLDTLPERIEKSFAGFFYWRTRKAIQKRRKAIPLSVASPDSIADDDETRRIEDWEVIEKCRRTLTETQQRIFELRYIEELSLDEIARAQDSTVNAVGQNIFRLSKRMRECLAGFFDR